MIEIFQETKSQNTWCKKSHICWKINQLISNWFIFSEISCLIQAFVEGLELYLQDVLTPIYHVLIQQEKGLIQDNPGFEHTSCPSKIRLFEVNSVQGFPPKRTKACSCCISIVINSASKLLNNSQHSATICIGLVFLPVSFHQLLYSKNSQHEGFLVHPSIV